MFRELTGACQSMPSPKSAAKKYSSRTTRLVLAVACLTSSLGHAETSDELGNWFNDPFLQVRTGFANCPIPLGPLITHKQARDQEHYRVERGNSCYQSGECKKPNSYLYDQDISLAIGEYFSTHAAPLSHSTLWITISRRFVFVEGCSKEDDDLKHVQADLRALPDVQAVQMNITSDPRVHIPYHVLTSRDEVR